MQRNFIDPKKLYKRRNSDSTCLKTIFIREEGITKHRWGRKTKNRKNIKFVVFLLAWKFAQN